ncbi:50S ribosomal protein L13 [Candidatus Roizmanbacteria bacterium]|nr:50S ribosomal protein L13 [Candidatus Roizmanbacteria bacterium]
MINLTHSTKSIKGNTVKRDWILVDLSGKVVGRIAPHIATLLQGKHKAAYVPYLDVGDYVIGINAKKLVITGKKAQTKTYTKYSGYPGGLKKISYQTLLDKKPGDIIKHAVSGMLPKNKLRDQRLKRLFVYADDKYPYGDKIKKID